MSSVSVIIPTWNRADMIEKAIRSALNQTVSPLEVLVCDDGSSDDTEAVVAAIGDRRVRWVPGERGGRPAIPRNRGIRESRGEWLAFLDSDDEWLSQKLEKQLEIAAKSGHYAVCSNAYRLSPKQGVIGPFLDIPEGKELFDFKDLVHTNYVICSSVLLHRSVLKDTVGFPENPEFIIGEDYALWLRVATRTRFAFHRDCLLYYLDDAGSSVRSRGKEDMILKKRILGDFLGWARSVPKAVVREDILFAKLGYSWAVADIHAGPLMRVVRHGRSLYRRTKGFRS